ncbi:MAG: transposase [Nitrospirae bacterium]|nr:MAG: transposase [Nitrospirota bacterium]
MTQKKRRTCTQAALSPLCRGMVGMILVMAECVSDARKGLNKYFAFYNQRRPHTALADKTPDEVYFDNLPALSQTA